MLYGVLVKANLKRKHFAVIMNLPPPPTSYSKIVKLLGAAAERVCRDLMRDAFEEAVEFDNGNGDIDVAFDGT